jgi:DNA-binding NtrC family response regulator
LLESELFGHERGAFTGAQHRRVGRFEQAHGGTLFLDEVGDLPLETQAKLLRLLEERQVQRLGGREAIPVDVRVLAATHRNLEDALTRREFREDLYFRLNVLTITVPSLQEHAEDIPELVRYFVRRYAPDLKIASPAIQADALQALQEQPWPGNVRELENVVRQALVLARPFGVTAGHVRQALARSRGCPPVGEQTHAVYVADLLSRAERGEIEGAYWQMIEDLEPELYAQALRRAGGNQAQAARWLGITRLKLRERLRSLGMHPTDPAG